MSLMFGNYQDENVKPVLVDSQGRPLVVLDAVTGTYLNVDVHSLPPIPAGSNLIGKVDINSQPAGVLAGMTSLPAGSNVIGKVDINSPIPLQVSSKSGDKLLGVSGVVRGIYSNTNLSAGNQRVRVVTVPAGEMWMITHLGIAYVGTVSTVRLSLELTVSTIIYTLGAFSPVVSSGWYFSPAPILVIAGESLGGHVSNATAGDDLYIEWIGYKMNLP